MRRRDCFPRFLDDFSVIYTQFLAFTQTLRMGDNLKDAVVRAGKTNERPRSNDSRPHEASKVHFISVAVLIQHWSEVVERAGLSLPEGTTLERLTEDAVRVLEEQGELLWSQSRGVDLVHLNLHWLVDAMRPISNHRLCITVSSEEYLSELLYEKRRTEILGAW